MASYDHAEERKSNDADPTRSTSGHRRVAGGRSCIHDRTTRTFPPRRGEATTVRRNRSNGSLSRGEMGRIANMTSSQRKHELSNVLNRPLVRIRPMLRLYYEYEASKPGLRNVLLIPIRIHDRESQVEKLLYRQNGRKVRLVMAGTREPDEGGPWRTKRDDLERLCKKVGVPFLSVPRIEKVRRFVHLGKGDAYSVCGIIVSFGLQTLWDDFDILEREIAYAKSVNSFVARLENSSADFDQQSDRSLKSKRLTLDAEESESMKLTSSPLTVDEETTHAPSCADEAVPTEAKKRSIDESRQPIPAPLSQPEQAACLPVGDADDDAGRPDPAPLLRDLSSSNDTWRERTDMILSPSDDDIVEGEPECEERPSKAQKIELHTSATLSEQSSECERTTQSSTLDAALLPEARVQNSSNSFTSSHGSVPASASKINRLEVEELLLASNIESLSQLARAIDGQIDACRSKLDDLSSHRDMAESRQRQCHELVERESSALDTIEASLAQNHVRMAFLLSETLSAPTMYRILEALEEPSLTAQESTFPCSSESGVAMEPSSAGIELLMSPPCDSDDGTSLEPGEELVVHQ